LVLGLAIRFQTTEYIYSSLLDDKSARRSRSEQAKPGSSRELTKIC
jgi:hypothetical protein